MSRWANWSSGTQTKMSLSSFMLQEEKGRPVPGEPEEIARQNGWTGKEYGWYVDNSGTVVGRAIQGQMYVYDTDPRAEGQVDNGNPTSAASGQTPGDKARAMGLQSNGKGSYIDPQTGQVAARTVNNELVFYDQRPGGGAVSDGAGGRALTQSAPSWQDPVTGMIIVPPAQPEDPQEQASVPDPVPAQAPDGFSAYMMKVKIDTYEKEKREREIEGEVAQKTEQMQGMPAINQEYQAAEQDQQAIDQNLADGKIDQARHQKLSQAVTEAKERLELAADRVTQDTEGMDPQYVEQAADLQAKIAMNEGELAQIETEREDMQAGKDYQTAGPEDQQLMDQMFEDDVAGDIEAIHKEVEQYQQQYEKTLQQGKEAQELSELKEAMIDPSYDLNAEGSTIGSGKYGTVTDPGDGNVIKTGKINRKEAQIMAKLNGTGVGPRIVNFQAAGPGSEEDRMAMTRIEGKPLSLVNKNATVAQKNEVLQSYITKLGRMHQAGISHGDLHGGNVIVGQDNQATLVDFGFSQDERMWKVFLEAQDAFNNNGLGVGIAPDGPVAEKMRENYFKSHRTLVDGIKAAGMSGMVDLIALENIDYYTPTNNRDGMGEETMGMIGTTENQELDRDVETTGINKIPDEIFQEALRVLYDGFE